MELYGRRSAILGESTKLKFLLIVLVGIYFQL